MMLGAIERAGSTDPQKIRDAIEKTKGFQGITGVITIDDHHNAIKSAVIREVKGNEFVYIASVNP
jgi:branched-chain amino acid transport system substrate-binding protein